jgi:hypothetical protein
MNIKKFIENCADRRDTKASEIAELKELAKKPAIQNKLIGLFIRMDTHDKKEQEAMIVLMDVFIALDLKKAVPYIMKKTTYENSHMTSAFQYKIREALYELRSPEFIPLYMDKFNTWAYNAICRVLVDLKNESSIKLIINKREKTDHQGYDDRFLADRASKCLSQMSHPSSVPLLFDGIRPGKPSQANASLYHRWCAYTLKNMQDPALIPLFEEYADDEDKAVSHTAAAAIENLQKLSS